MDRGAWRATVLRVTKSWTWLKRLSTHAVHIELLNNTPIISLRVTGSQRKIWHMGRKKRLSKLDLNRSFWLYYGERNWIGREWRERQTSKGYWEVQVRDYAAKAVAGCSGDEEKGRTSDLGGQTENLVTLGCSAWRRGNVKVFVPGLPRLLVGAAFHVNRKHQRLRYRFNSVILILDMMRYSRGTFK